MDIAPLLCLALNKTSAQLYANPHYPLSFTEQNTLKHLREQRLKGVPFAYLSGKQGFYHLEFRVSADTLIPRPETELLIDIALDLYAENQVTRVVDLGTGSGIIAITLADLRPHWHLTATDISQNALAIAQQNATQNTTQKIDFQQGDWFAAIKNQTFDLIISNPPYIAANDAHLRALTHEPQQALISGKDGLDDIQTMIAQAPNYLKNNGYLLLEHGHNQRAEVVRLLGDKFHNIQKFSDYNQRSRAVLAQINTNPKE